MPVVALQPAAREGRVVGEHGAGEVLHAAQLTGAVGERRTAPTRHRHWHAAGAGQPLPTLRGQVLQQLDRAVVADKLATGDDVVIVPDLSVVSPIALRVETGKRNRRIGAVELVAALIFGPERLAAVTLR